MYPSPKTASSSLRRIFRMPSVGIEGGARAGDICHSVPLSAAKKDGTKSPCVEAVSVDRIKTHDPNLAQSFIEHSSHDTTFILTPVRHTLSRVVSNYFQSFFPAEKSGGAGLLQAKVSADSLMPKFLETTDAWGNYTTYGRKYVKWVGKFLGVQLGEFAKDADFKHDGGLFLKTTCPKRNKTLITLVLRVEDLEKDAGSWVSTLKHFFNEADMDLADEAANGAGANTAGSKSYGEMYSDFKVLLQEHSNSAWCNRLVEIDEMSVFYSDEENKKLIAAKCGK